MSQVEVDKIIPQSGTTLTIGDSGDTITVASGATLTGDLNADNLTSGTVPSARISGAYTGITQTGTLANSGATVTTFNRTTSDGSVLDIQKDGTTRGIIATESDGLIFSNDTRGIKVRDDACLPRNVNLTTADNIIDLGTSLSRFKDLYLGGGLYVGGTGTANKLDDYEEGTFTPAYSFGGGSVTYFAQNGIYTKIGNVVYYAVSIATSSISSLSGNVSITGLPFTVDDSTAASGATIGIAYRFGTDMPNLKLRPTSNDGIQFWKHATNSTSATRVTGSDFISGTAYNNISFSGSYRTTA